MPRRGRGGRAVPRAGAERVRRRRPAACRTPCWRASRPPSPSWSRRRPTCCRCSSSGPRSCTARASSTRPWSSTAGCCWAWSLKSYLPTYREFYERRWFAPGDDRRDATITVAGRDRAVRARPDLRRDRRARAAAARGDLRGHVGADPAEQRGGARRCDGAGQPVGQPDHGRPGRGPAAAGAQRERAVLARRTSSPPPARGSRRPTCRGTARRWSTSAATCSPRPTASPRRRSAASPTSTSTGSVRSASGRAPSTTTGAPTTRGCAASAPSPSSCSRRPVTSACVARSTASRSCPTTSSGSRSTATRPTTSRCPGSSSGCTPSASRAIMIGVSGGLDSTHALIVAAKAMDRLGRPRADIHAFTMPGFATGETTKSYATRLAKSLGVTFEELDITSAARQMLSDLDHPFASGEAVYDVTFENVQAGLRTDYLFRLANHRGGIVLGTGDLSELALGWCTYGVGDQMSHYNVNGGVPKTLIQHLIRWVIESGQFSGAVRRRHQRRPRRDPRAGDHPRADPAHRGGQAAGDRGLRRPLRPPGLHALPRAPPRLPAGEDRLPRLARLARRGRGGVAAGLPGRAPDGVRPADRAGVARRLREALLRQPVQALGAAQRPQGLRRAARCRRAATGGCRRTPPRPPGWPRSNATSRSSSSPAVACNPPVDLGV